MKFSNLKYIFTFLFFMCFLSINKIDAKEINCSYEIPLSGAQGSKLSPKINLIFDTETASFTFSDGTPLQVFDIDATITTKEIEKVDNYVITLGKKSDNIYDFYDNDPEETGNYVCPTLFYKLRDEKIINHCKNKYTYRNFAGFDECAYVNVIQLYGINSSSRDTNGTSVQLNPINPETGEVNKGGIAADGSTATTCTLQKPIRDFAECPGCSDSDVTSFNWYIYKDGTYKLCVDGTDATPESEKQSCMKIITSGSEFENLEDDDYVWKMSSSHSGYYTFVIRKKDLPGLLQLYKYGDSVCYKDLYITPIKRGATFALSAVEIDDGYKGSTGTVVGDYDPDADSVFTGKYQFVTNPVTDFVGVCVDYLGSVNDEGENLAKLFDSIYDFIKIASIVLVIVLSMIDFIKVMTNNKDELSKTVKKNAIRLGLLILILWLPTFIDMIGNLFGKPDILCGIK